MTAPRTYDVFLSHATADKPWVRTFAAELEAQGLSVFLDEHKLDPGDNFVLELSDGLRDSRFLVLVLSPQSAERPWVVQEWAAFLAKHGPVGRVLPVVLESAEVPTILGPIQRLDATDRDAVRVAGEVARVVGRPGEIPEGDARRLVIGLELTFVVSRRGQGEEERWVVTGPDGRPREVEPPWRTDPRLGVALFEFGLLTGRPVTTDQDRADLTRHATLVGEALFDFLFASEEGAAALGRATLPGRGRPLVTVRSDDDLLLSLPWELVHRDGSFLLRDGRIDLARSVPGEVGAGALLGEPTGYLSLVVNVSAPEGSGLDYEGESYRITRALSERCAMVPTELGTVEDLLETVARERPTGVHFSGHGAPGKLAFEDDEGRPEEISIDDLVRRLRERQPHGVLPPFFYLASCHGNTPPDVAAETAGSGAAAARLHREGVAQVVGYSGPIVDELSTRAEEALYGAIAAGGTTRHAVVQAREALGRPFGSVAGRHRPGESRAAGAVAAGVTTGAPVHTHPFAWAQLVLYHRGPDRPLSLPVPAEELRRREEGLERTLVGAGHRRWLGTGFIGRRGELHRLRRRIREGEKVFVLQGLGGLGKSTLAFYLLPILAGEADRLVLWCQVAETRPDPAVALVDQLLAYCRGRFGVEWEGVVQAVDRQAGDDAAERFGMFLGTLLQKAGQPLVAYLDNLESLLVGPEDPRAARAEGAFGEWRGEDVARIWALLAQVARESGRLRLVASCRYRHRDFSGAELPVSPLPPDALYRLMGWFPALRRLTGESRAQLVGRLAGHPRAVEFANDLVGHRLAVWQEEHDLWRLPEPPEPEDLEREWRQIVSPALPEVEERLRDDLLLAEICEQILEERGRRMLYRMSLLRRSWEWALVEVLGEEDASAEEVLATAQRLRATSLVEAVELNLAAGGSARRYTLHPATAAFVRERLGGDGALRSNAHWRIGGRLEAEAERSPYIETDLEAGHHLFEAKEYDRASELLGSASDWLRNHGRVREGLAILEPFLGERVTETMQPVLVGRLLGTVGLAYAALGEVQKAMGYYEQQLTIAREIGDRQGEGSALGNLGIAYARLGEVQKAIGYYEQRLVIAREIGDRRGEGAALGNLGNAYSNLGEVEKAIGYYEQHLVIAREIGDRRGEGAALGNLGVAYADLGEVQEAIGYYKQRLVIAREIGDRRGEGKALGNLGVAYASLGEVQKAIGYYEQNLVIAREIGDRRGEGSALGNLGLAYARLGEVEKAILLLERSLAIGQAIEDPQIVRVCSAQLAELRRGS